MAPIPHSLETASRALFLLQGAVVAMLFFRVSRSAAPRRLSAPLLVSLVLMAFGAAADVVGAAVDGHDVRALQKVKFDLMMRAGGLKGMGMMGSAGGEVSIGAVVQLLVRNAPAAVLGLAGVALAAAVVWHLALETPTQAAKRALLIAAGVLIAGVASQLAVRPPVLQSPADLLPGAVAWVSFSSLGALFLSPEVTESFASLLWTLPGVLSAVMTSVVYLQPRSAVGAGVFTWGAMLVLAAVPVLRAGTVGGTIWSIAARVAVLAVVSGAALSALGDPEAADAFVARLTAAPRHISQVLQPVLPAMFFASILGSLLAGGRTGVVAVVASGALLSWRWGPHPLDVMVGGMQGMGRA